MIEDALHASIIEKSRTLQCSELLNRYRLAHLAYTVHKRILIDTADRN